MLNFAEKTGSDTEIFYFSDAERRVFKARDRVAVSTFAERELYLGAGERFNLELVPYAREPLDTFKLPWVRKIFLEWAPQTGKTATAKACLGYCIAVDPGPAMYIMADEKTTRRISRRQLKRLFRQSPVLAGLLGDRADDVTTLEYRFQNGMDLLMAWASSAPTIASESIRYLFYDEPGKYPEWSGREADPFSLAEQRQNRYEATSKQMYFSTPNLAGDPFDMLLQTEPDEVRHYHARCPVCGELQVMEDSSIHAGGCKDHREIRRKKLARYTCVKCKMDWDDYMRNQAVSGGRWKSEHPVERPAAVAFRSLSSWYSQFVSLSTGLADFFKAKEDPNKFQAYWTQHKCRAWAERLERKDESELLAHKNEIPAGVAPEWAVALTAGIDTQKRGFWFVVRAWGADLTSHLVQHGYLATFEDVEALLYKTTYPVQGGDGSMGIWRAAIDTGGSEGETEEETRTEEVYQFIAQMRYRHGEKILYGIKGASRRQFLRVGPEKSVESKPAAGKRRRWRGIVTIRMIDTYQMKSLLWWRLGRKEKPVDEEGSELAAESQRVYLNSEVGMDYARQFLAEELRTDRRGRRFWKQVRRDNHLLDAEVYAAACADSSWQPNLSALARHLEIRKREVGSVDVEVGRKEAGSARPAGGGSWMRPQGGNWIKKS